MRLADEPRRSVRMLVEAYRCSSGAVRGLGARGLGARGLGARDPRPGPAFYFIFGKIVFIFSGARARGRRPGSRGPGPGSWPNVKGAQRARLRGPTCTPTCAPGVPNVDPNVGPQRAPQRAFGEGSMRDESGPKAPGPGAGNSHAQPRVAVSRWSQPAKRSEMRPPSSASAPSGLSWHCPNAGKSTPCN